MDKAILSIKPHLETRDLSSMVVTRFFDTERPDRNLEGDAIRFIGISVSCSALVKRFGPTYQVEILDRYPFFELSGYIMETLTLGTHPYMINPTSGVVARVMDEIVRQTC